MSQKRYRTGATLSDHGRTRRSLPSAVGKAKEDEACRFLEGLGYQVVERNFRTRTGEIDAVARLGEILVFVEVRFRRQGSMVGAAESVTRGKIRRIRSAIKTYLAVRRIPDATPVRIDLCVMREELESCEVLAGAIECS